MHRQKTLLVILVIAIVLLSVTLTVQILAGGDDYNIGGAVDFGSFGYHEYGTEIDLSTIPVYPEPGYRFVGWKDAGGNFVTKVTLEADTLIYPVFEQIRYTLTVIISGGGSVDPGLPGTYDHGASVALDAGSATADSGYTFLGYRNESGDFISFMLMDDDKTVTAVFRPESCAITLQSGGNGAVGGVGGELQILTETGAEIDLSTVDHTPDEGYELSHWENEAGEVVSLSYTVPGDQTLTAVFVPLKYTLTVTSEGSGSVLDGLGGSYARGSTVYLDSSFAQPGSGHMFSKFVDEGGENVSFVMMDANKTVTARFTPQQYPLYICVMTDDGTNPYAVNWYVSGTNVHLGSIAVSVSGMGVERWLDEGLNPVSSVTLNSDTLVYAVLYRIRSASPGAPYPEPPPGAPPVFRLFGADHYRTAVAVSKAGWESAFTVLLARGDDFPDSLAGVSLACQLNAPILLTQTGQLNSFTRSEISRLGASRVVILGGTGAVSAAVETELKRLGLSVDRISGKDRFETAAKIAGELAKERKCNPGTAFIAFSQNFPDALASASYGAVKGYPILLTGKDKMPGATATALRSLGITRAVIIGGTEVICNAVQAELEGMGLAVERISGANRYATSVELAKAYLPYTTGHVFIATGMSFPDALAGAVLAARENSGILLVDGSQSVPPAVVKQFYNSRNFTRVTIFGGKAALSEGIEKNFGTRY